MIEDGVTPNQLSKDHFEIPLYKGDKTYVVSKYAHKWQCTCIDYQFRHVRCKHIHAVTLGQRLSKKIEDDHTEKSVFAVTLNSGIVCKFCNSTEIIKYGKANNKQVYKCKSCARKFVPNEGFEGMKYDPRVVTTTTLDLYFIDVSLRKITDHLGA